MFLTELKLNFTIQRQFDAAFKYDPAYWRLLQSDSWDIYRGFFNEIQDKNFDLNYQNTDVLYKLHPVEFEMAISDNLLNSFSVEDFLLLTPLSLDSWFYTNGWFEAPLPEVGFWGWFFSYPICWLACFEYPLSVELLGSDLRNMDSSSNTFPDNPPFQNLKYNLNLPLPVHTAGFEFATDLVALGPPTGDFLPTLLGFLTPEQLKQFSLNSDNIRWNYDYIMMFVQLERALNPYKNTIDGTPYFIDGLNYIVHTDLHTVYQRSFLRSLLWNPLCFIAYFTKLDSIGSFLLYKFKYGHFSWKLYLIWFSCTLFVYFWTDSHLITTYKGIIWEVDKKKRFYSFETPPLNWEERWELTFWLRYPRNYYRNWKSFRLQNALKRYDGYLNKFFTLKPYYKYYVPIIRTPDIVLYQLLVDFFRNNYSLLKTSLIHHKKGLFAYIWVPRTWLMGFLFDSIPAVVKQFWKFFPKFVVRYGREIRYLSGFCLLFMIPALLHILTECAYIALGVFYSYSQLKVYTYYFNYVMFWQFTIALLYIINLCLYIYVKQGGGWKFRYTYCFWYFLWFLFFCSILFIFTEGMFDNTFPSNAGKKISSINICLFFFTLVYSNHYFLIFFNLTAPKKNWPWAARLYNYNKWYNLSFPYWFGFLYLCCLDYDDLVLTACFFFIIAIYKLVYWSSLWWIEELVFGNRTGVYVFGMLILSGLLWHAPTFFFFEGLENGVPAKISPDIAIGLYHCVAAQGLYLELAAALVIPGIIMITGGGYIEYGSKPDSAVYWRYLRIQRFRGAWYGIFVIDIYLIMIFSELRFLFLGFEFLYHMVYSYFLFVTFRSFTFSKTWRALTARIQGFLGLSVYIWFILPIDQFQLYLGIQIFIMVFFLHNSSNVEEVLGDSHTKRTFILETPREQELSKHLEIMERIKVRRWFKIFYTYLVLIPFFFVFPLIPLSDLLIYNPFIAHRNIVFYWRLLNYIPFILVYWLTITMTFTAFFRKTDSFNMFLKNHWLPLWAVHLTNILYFITACLLAYYMFFFFIHIDTTSYVHWKNFNIGSFVENPIYFIEFGEDHICNPDWDY